jgi:hypothetical protein
MGLGIHCVLTNFLNYLSPFSLVKRAGDDFMCIFHLQTYSLLKSPPPISCRASFPNGGRRWRCPGTCEHCSGSMKHVIVRGYGQIIISAASFPVIWWRLTPPLGSFQNFSPHQTLPCLSQPFHRSSSLTYTYALRPFLYPCFHRRHSIVLHVQQIQSMMTYKLLTIIKGTAFYVCFKNFHASQSPRELLVL